MVQTNKILTVSYGTFSCTLEGFDDAFGTMKAIAEYFRDLAADDRYFGAEPPQPDADMLARIAQREISRRVDAHSDGTGILLRATDPAPAPAPQPAPAPAAPVAAQPASPATAPGAPAEAAHMPSGTAYPEDLVQDDTAEDMPEAEDVDARVVLAPMADNLADKLARIRAVVDRKETTAPEIEETAFDAAPAPGTGGNVTSFENTQYGSFEQADPTPGTVGADLPAQAAELADTAREEEILAAAAEAIDPDESTLDAVSTALYAPQSSTYAPRDMADAPIDDSFSDSLDDAYEADYAASDAAYEEAFAAPLNETAGEDAGDTPEELSAEAFELDAPLQPDPEDVPAPSAEMAEVEPLTLTSTYAADPADAPKTRDATDADTAETPEEDEANVFRTIDWDRDDEDDQADDEAIRNILGELGPRGDAVEAGVQAAASGPVTRVIKVKRAALEEAVASGTLEEVEETAATADAPAPDASAAKEPAAEPEQLKSSLSAADEADLQAELDAVAAELAEAQAALNPPDEKAPRVRTSAERHDRHRGSEVIEGARPDVNRLMAEADTKMHEPESSSRREAYSHLRAAVAAAEAEETLGAEEGAKRLLPREDEAYREDLASVVRPRRPETSGIGSRPRRPETADRAAPLKLVAEQRVDADPPRPQRGPIRPRRVAAQAVSDPEGGTPGGFAAFANEVGARELSELLEAAAAYMSFVEGWEQFSRPQLMTRVKQASTTGFNREDGLRTFGQLLREGKIEKTSGGRFTASEQIGYRPAHKATG